VTGKVTGEPEYALISGATLDETLDGVLIKTYLHDEGLSAARLRNLLKTRRGITPHGPRETEPRDRDLEKTAREQLHPDRPSEISDLAEQLQSHSFWGLLAKLFPSHNGTISLLRGGASGASVLKVRTVAHPDGANARPPKTWIVKMSRDVDLIHREIQSYASLLDTNIPRQVIPRIRNQDVEDYHGLAGFALEFEDNTQTYREHFKRPATETTTENIHDALFGVLREFFGTIALSPRPVWTYFNPPEGARLRVRACLESLEELSGVGLDSIAANNIAEFVSHEPSEDYWLPSFAVDWIVGTTHGDLNSGNVLVADDGIRLIDFSESKMAPLSRDIAKLERDLYLRVLDDGSVSEYDRDRLEVWRSMIPVIANGVSADIPSGLDTHCVQVMETALDLRSRYYQLVDQECQDQYLPALYYFLSIGSAIPNLSPFKRVFAIETAAMVLQKIEEFR